MSSPQRVKTSLWSEFVELLSSMRFAVSLLSFVCVASVIGTVLPQNDAPINYLNKFGAFWTEVFERLSLFQVYNAWWFLVVMGFLVLSTSLCLIKNTPKMLKDMRSFRDNIRESSLNAFPHKLSYQSVNDLRESSTYLRDLLKRLGYTIKAVDKDTSLLIAAKKGSGNRWGYIFAHGAIVLVCIGGLLDSELQIKLQLMFLGKEPIENRAINEVPESARLSVLNPSFRANMFLSERSDSNYAVVRVDEKFLLQPLPFSIQLNQFAVDYYSTGMPKDFASHVTVTDLDDGTSFDTVIRVNHPLKYRGVTVYQSSFDDGGSALSLKLLNIASSDSTEPLALDLKVGYTQTIQVGSRTDDTVTFNLLSFSPINVENMSAPGESANKRFQDHVAAVTDSALSDIDSNMRNLGPMFSYRITDNAGQFVDYKNYMLPINLEDGLTYLFGVKRATDPEFLYLHIPADEESGIDEFLTLRRFLLDANRHDTMVASYIDLNFEGMGLEEKLGLNVALKKMLQAFNAQGFAGIEEVVMGATNLNDEQRNHMRQLMFKILQDFVVSTHQEARQSLGRSPLSNEMSSEQMLNYSRWLNNAMVALNGMATYPSPMLATLSTYDEVKASVFQVARSPGTWGVYIGSVMLALGVFAMFYIKERRIWVWIKPTEHGSQVRLAMSATRRTLDFENEFQQLQTYLNAYFKQESSYDSNSKRSA